MTSPWTPMGSSGPDQQDFFQPAMAQKHLLLLRIHAEARGVITKHCPDGWVRKPGKDPIQNNAVQVSVVDLNWQNPDGTLGKIYPDAMIQAGTLVKDLKREVGKTKLLMWKQADEPKDAYGNPASTNPYSIVDMSANLEAAAAANAFLAAHPEFMQIPVPPPYEPRPPAPPAPPPPPGWGTQYPQIQPQQQGWQSPQVYPPAQPQGYPPQAPAQQWQQPPAPQWTPPALQQQPAAWNTAAPPPGYYQQQGPPPQQPQAQPGSFYEAAAQMPPQQVPQGPAYNHHGQPQPIDPPY